MLQLSPFQIRLIDLRLRGLSLQEISEITGRSYGHTRLDFHQIYKKLKIHLTCQLFPAYEEYKKQAEIGA